MCFGTFFLLLYYKRKNKDYIPDDPTEIRHVDEVLKLLRVMTEAERYKQIFQKKKGVRSICDVAKRLVGLSDNSNVKDFKI